MAGIALQAYDPDDPFAAICGAPGLGSAAGRAATASSGRRGSGGFATAPAGVVQSVQRLDRQAMQSSLDRMFEDLIAAAGRPAMMEPPAEVVLPLFPHQKQALAWMVTRENSSALPPFWEARSAGGARFYFNSLTNFSSTTRPEPMRGGEGVGTAGVVPFPTWHCWLNIF